MIRVSRIVLVVVGPDIVVAAMSRARAARALEPGMLVGGVVDDQLGDDADAARVAPRAMSA